MFVGVDIGTQSLEAVVCGPALDVLGDATVAYQPTFPRPGCAEQDPRLCETAIGPAIRGALERAGVPAEAVAALGIAGQLDGSVPGGGDGGALGPALIWMDRRAADEPAGIDVDHSTRLENGPDDIAAHCEHFMASDAAGADLLAYRADDAAPLDLVRAARKALGGGELVVAGSITGRAQIEDLAAAGADGFTVGTAVFEGAFSPRRGDLAAQVRAILDCLP